jgi:putative spermidine/putrescine transport system substrate-binding protein
MGYCPTVTNANLPSELAKEIEFTAEERANFFKQDLAYIDKNQSQLIDWWTRIFKA